MTIDEMIAVLQAAKEGKPIQCRLIGGPWCSTANPAWNFFEDEYRVKPEPREWWEIRLSEGVVLGKYLTLESARADLDAHYTAAKIVHLCEVL